MSDALTDIARNEELAEENSRINQLELDFCKNPSTDKAKKLIQKLKGLVGMKSGYWNSSPRSWAYERISLYTDFMQYPNSADEIKKAVKSQQQYQFHFAVGGHERLMGERKDVAIIALRKKYQDVPHAFKAVVEDDGRLNLEKISCVECVNGRGCSLTNACNCYNQEEYETRVRRVKIGKLLVQRLL